MVPTQGTAIGRAIALAMNSFTPDQSADKAIIVITDAEFRTIEMICFHPVQTF